MTHWPGFKGLRFERLKKPKLGSCLYRSNKIQTGKEHWINQILTLKNFIPQQKKPEIFFFYFQTDLPFKEYVDPALSLAIVILILFSTVPLLQESSLILSQVNTDFSSENHQSVKRFQYLLQIFLNSKQLSWGYIFTLRKLIFGAKKSWGFSAASRVFSAQCFS